MQKIYKLDYNTGFYGRKNLTLGNLKDQFGEVEETYSQYRNAKLVDKLEKKPYTINKWIDYQQELTKLKLMFEEYGQVAGKGIEHTPEEEAFLAPIMDAKLLENILEKGYDFKESNP